MSKGWVKLHRQIQDCWIWDADEKFDKAHAWIDLLLLANHADKKISADGKPLVITKGQFLTSRVKLAARWNWNVKTVDKFLNTLESSNMIVQDRTHRWTTLTIVNYSVYQEVMDKSMDMSMDKSMDNSMDKSMDTNKNVKNIKNEKNESNIYVVKSILDYLNEKSGKRYTTSNQNSVRHIRARLNEGFTFEDFKKVIDTKVPQWARSSEMKKYIRPETLFGTKFEGYLNEGGLDNGRSVSVDDEPLTAEQIEALKRAGFGLR